MIYNAIQDHAKVSLVDHRFILATILQEVCSIILSRSRTSLTFSS